MKSHSCASLTGLLTIAAAGCFTPPPPKLSVAHPDPGVKIPAMKQAVATRDLNAAAQLVKDLESDDAAVRFFAIESLYRLTGQRFEYDYYAPAERRALSVKRWQQWLEEQE